MLWKLSVLKNFEKFSGNIFGAAFCLEKESGADLSSVVTKAATGGVL